jgi:HEAT repeat protein
MWLLKEEKLPALERKMKLSNKLTKESCLNTDINELAHSITQELSMAAKKTSIYGSNHPIASKSIERPFILMDKLFKFKKYININLKNGNLYVLNIRLKESVFSQEIIKFMQVLDINAILFSYKMTATEFGLFLDRLVRRVSKASHTNLFREYLKEKNIKTIEINSELCYKLFEDNQQYRGDAISELPLATMILNYLPDEIMTMAKLSSGQENIDDNPVLIDFDQDLVTYLMPERITSKSPKGLEKSALEFINKLLDFTGLDNQQEQIVLGKELFRLIEFHPQHDYILKNIQSSFVNDPHATEIIKTMQPTSTKIKMESSQHIDEMMDEIFNERNAWFPADEFISGYTRIIKTGQHEKAVEISLKLVNMLENNDSGFRQKALNLLEEIIKPLNLMRDQFIFDKIIQTVLRNLFEKKETYEYSEFIWQLIEKCLFEKNYETLSKIMTGLRVRRHIENDITIYDSAAVKKVYNNINQPVIIKSLVDELIRFDTKNNKFIKDILISTGTNEVAIALANIVTDSKRQVRQIALKILAELGKSSLNVLSSILMDDSLYERADGRRELPDNKWYIIRNSIFVLGLLKDPEAISSLRLRISDPDVRIRREIISSLEKIGGEEAVDILMMMAGDEDREIRGAAVISIGLIGSSENTPMLVEIAKSNPKIITKVVNSLSRLGGKEVEEFLTRMLSDKEYFDEVTGGIASKEEVRLAIVKALGQMGNKKTIKQYKNNLSTTQKIFFKNSPVNKAIEDILAE